MRTVSSISGKVYDMEDVCIIVNIAQVAAYIKNGYYPVDMNVGRDDKLCFMFLKTEYGRQMFDKWVRHEL